LRIYTRASRTIKQQLARIVRVEKVGSQKSARKQTNVGSPKNKKAKVGSKQNKTNAQDRKSRIGTKLT